MHLWMVSNLIFGVFWLFLAILTPKRSQFAISPPGLGGHESDKELIGHRFHAFLGGLNPNFWRFFGVFRQILANFDPKKS